MVSSVVLQNAATAPAAMLMSCFGGTWMGSAPGAVGCSTQEAPERNSFAWVYHGTRVNPSLGASGVPKTWNAKECEVCGMIPVPLNVVRASSRTLALNARYRPRRFGVDSAMNRRVEVLPVPAPASKTSPAPLR